MKDHRHPLVSVLIAAYGRPDFLERAIRSVLAQSGPSFELIVANDVAPTDCRRVLDSIQDPRVRVHHQSRNVGCWSNWTTAVRMATGQYLVFLGDDDELPPGFLQAQVAALEQAPEAALSACQVDEVTPEGTLHRSIIPRCASGVVLGPDVLLDELLHQKVFFGGALFRREQATRIWMQTEPDGMVADHGLLLRMAVSEGCRFLFARVPPYRKTNHPGQLSAQFIEVTRLHMELMRRLTASCSEPAVRHLLRTNASDVGILLARHHAAAGDLAKARACLAGTLRRQPGLPRAWSQFLQAWILPGRMERTARQQRGL